MAEGAEGTTTEQGTPDAGGEGKSGGGDDYVAPGDVRNAVQESIQGARERLQAGESLVELEEPAEEEAPAAEDVEVEEDDAGEDLPEGEGEPLPDEEGQAADDVEDVDTDVDEDEAPDEDAGEDEEEQDDDDLVVKVPGRRPDDPDVEVEVDDPDVAERLRQLRNGYLRGEQLRERGQEVAEREAEQQFIDNELAADPAGFLLSRVSEAHRKEVLKALLAEDSLYDDDEIQDALREWDLDPDARESFREKHKTEREAAADKRRSRAQQEKAARSAVRDIASNITKLIPGDMPTERQDRFYRAAMRAAESEVMRSGQLQLDRERLISVLDHEGILEGYGIDPGEDAADAASGTSGRRRARAKPRSREPGKRQPTADEARSTGDRLKEKSRKRRAAAAAAPAGAGAPAASIELPEGQSVKERIETVRKKGVAAFLSG